MKRLLPFVALAAVPLLVFLGLRTDAVDRYLSARLPGWVHPLGLELSYSAFDFDPHGPRVRVEGLALRSTAGDLEVTAQALELRVYPLESLLGKLRLSARAEALAITAEIGAGGGDGGGGMPQVAFRSLVVEGGSLSLRAPDREFGLELPSFRVQWEGQVGEAELSGGILSWHGQDEPIQRVAVSGKRRFGVFEFEELLAETQRLRLTAKGQAGPWGLLDLELAARADLTDLPAAWLAALGMEDALALGALVEVSGRAEGSLDAPVVQGELTLTRGVLGPIEVESVAAAFDGDGRELAFRSLAARTSVGSADGVHGKVTFGEQVLLAAEGEVTDFDLRPFMGVFLDGHFPVGIRASGAFAAHGPVFPQLELDCRVAATGRDLDVTVGEAAPRTTVFSLPSGRVRSRCTVGTREIRFGPTAVETAAAAVEIPSGRIEYRTGLWFDTEVTVRNLDLIRSYLPAGFEAAGRARGRLGGPYTALEFGYDLELESVRVFGTELGRVSGRAEYDLTTVRTEQLALDGPLGKLRVAGSLGATASGQYDLGVEWTEIDLTALGDLLQGLPLAGIPAVTGVGRARGRLSGPLAAPSFRGELAAEGVAYERYTLDAVTAKGTFSPGEWRLEDAVIVGHGARITGTGGGNRETLSVTGRVAEVDLARIGALFAAGVPLAGRLAGEFALAGSFGWPRLDFSGAARGVALGGYPAGDVTFSGGIEDQRLEAVVTARDGAAWSSVSLGLRQPHAFGVDLEAVELGWGFLPLGLVPEGLTAASVTGKGVLSGALARSTESWAAAWEGVVQGFRWDTLDVGEVSLRADYAAGGGQLTASAWGGDFLLEAMLSDREGTPVALDVTLRDFQVDRLGPLTPLGSGNVTGQGQALLSLDEWNAHQGWARLHALADLAVSGRLDGVFLEEDLAVPPLEFRGSSPQGLPELWLTSEGIEVHGKVEDLEDLSWSVTASLHNSAPQQLLPRLPVVGVLKGRVTAEAQLSGRERELEQVAAAGRWIDLGYGRLAPSTWDWTARWAAGEAELEASESRGLAVRAHRSSDGSVAVRVEAEDAPLRGWVEDDGLPPTLSGVVTATADLELPAGGDPRGTLEVTRLVVSHPPYVLLQNREPLSAVLEGGRVRLERVAIYGEEMFVAVTGSVSPGAEWGLDVESGLDLATLPEWVPQVEIASGQVRAAMEIRGPWDAPTVEGPVEILAGAGLTVAGIDYPLQDLDARFYFQDSQGVRVDWVDAAFGDGRVHLEGTVDLEGLNPETFRLAAELRDIYYQYPSRTEYTFDADLLITGTPDAPEVRGEVRLEELLFSQRTSLQGLLLEAMKRRPRELKGMVETGGGLFADISVRGSENLRVQNNLADLALDVDLRVKGHFPGFVLWGRVEVPEGTVEVRGQEYEMLQSSVEFLGDAHPAPLLDLRARTVITNYAINLDVSGPVDDFQVTMSSSPPLPHDELVALLTLGQAPGETGGQSLTAVEAGSFLAGGLQEEVEGATGLDEFSIDATESVSGQTTVPRVTVGKAVTKEIRVRYSAAIGTETEQNAELQYILTPRVSVLGTWNDKGEEHKGSVGGEVRFRFTFR